MYRFRKIRHLIDYKELENQEIFFSELESLNDPMEGFKHYIWQGDKIIWENFFRHYLICLDSTHTLAILGPEGTNLSAKDILVFQNYHNLPTQLYKDKIDELCQAFFSKDGISDLVEILTARTNGLSRDELSFFLRIIHPMIAKIIVDFHLAMGLKPKREFPLPDTSDLIKKMMPELKKILEASEIDDELFSKLFSLAKQMFNQTDIYLAQKANNVRKDNRAYFIFSEFPNAYLKKIEELTYPDSYIACFMDNCTNPVVWAHYGDSHQGVALKYKPREQGGKLFLDLHRIIGLGNGPIYGKRPHPLNPITYTNEFPKQNFFESLGKLPVPQLARSWYQDKNNIKSALFDRVLSGDMESWRKDYWDKYEKSFHRKLKAWEYEKEYRIILTDLLGMHDNKDARKLKYEFSQLEGLVFGLRTPENIKLKIFEIIELKCKKENRNDFKFFQIEYGADNSRLILSELNMLKFS